MERGEGGGWMGEGEEMREEGKGIRNNEKC